MDLAEKLKIRDEMQRLGVDPADLQRTRLPPKENMFRTYKKNYNDFWKRIHRRFDINLFKPDGSAKPPESRTIQVKQDFDVQEFFEEYSSFEAENTFASILFKDLVDESSVTHLLSRWKIEFEGVYQ